MEPAEGERNAVVGISGQYRIAAEVVYRAFERLDWIRVADPSAGTADDFQYKCGSTRHALQVKWSQYPGTFTWADLVNASSDSPSLLATLARAWSKIRASWDGPLLIHLCSNNVASPNVSTAKGNQLKLAATAAPKHFAAFLETSWRPVRDAILAQPRDFDVIQSMPEYSTWAPAWDVWRQETALTEDEFVWFLAEFVIELGMSSVSASPDIDRDIAINELAKSLQDLVANPSRPSRVPRNTLIDILGWQDRLRYRHRHQFPVPATYVTNQAAQNAIFAALRQQSGGYLALIGPAGCGKSTLLSDMPFHGRVIRYYAFVPDSPDPLSGRGEAEYFLSDLSLALQEAGIGRSTQPVGLPNLRRTVQDQLIAAADLWTTRGERTLIILDGLDHVPREQNPDRSMLEELPGPAALADGVYVLLGTQTTSILPDPIQNILGGDPGRLIEVPPLTEQEVKDLVQKSSADLLMDSETLDTLIHTSGGHPLALTYLTQEVLRVHEVHADPELRNREADKVIEGAARFGGDINDRYRGYFRAVAGDDEVVQLLASVARLRTSIRIDWLRTWAADAAVSRFVDKASPYFWRDGDEWTFIHNSFRRFLLDETAKIGGVPDPQLERTLQTQIAQHCAASSPEWAMYREEEIAHRFLAQQYDEVVAMATADWLRTAVLDLRAVPNVMDHASLALRAAAKVDNREAFVPLFLLIGELQSRSQLLTGEQLASAMVTILPPKLAVDYVVRGGKLRIAAVEALRHAARWSAAGQRDVAALVIKAARGLSGVLTMDRGDGKITDAVRAWTEAVWHVSDLDTVLTQIDRYLPADQSGSYSVQEGESSWTPIDDDSADILRCRHEALVCCFQMLLAERDEPNLAHITGILDAEAPQAWRGWLRLERATAALEDGLNDEAAHWIREFLDIDEEMQSGFDRANSPHSGAAAETPPSAGSDEDEDEERRLPPGLRRRAALVLIQTGRATEQQLDQIVPWTERPPESTDYYGFGSLWQGQQVHRLHLLVSALRREIRRSEGFGPSAPGTSPPGPPTEPGQYRFEIATQALIDLEASYIAHSVGLTDDRPYVAAMADPILRLHEVPRAQTERWTGWYRITQSLPDMLASLISLAHRAGGTLELAKLMGKFDDAWTSSRCRYWSIELRQRVIAACASTDTTSHDWARRWLDEVAAEIDAREFEPSELVELWLRQAEINAGLGLKPRARECVARATAAAGRIGYGDDEYSLAHWAAWLTDALRAEKMSTDEFLTKASDFASRTARLSSVSREGAAAAAEALMAAVWPVSPRRSVQIGEALCDQGVLDEERMIQAAVLAALRDDDCALDLPVLVASKLLLPIMKCPSADLRPALAARHDAIALQNFDAALDLWTVDEPYLSEVENRSSQTLFPNDFETSPGAGAPAGADPGPSEQTAVIADSTTPQALLGQLARLDEAESLAPSTWTALCAGVLKMPMTAPTARSLLRQAERLGAPDNTIGQLVAIVADSGDTSVAVAALQTRLSRLPGYGWFRDYDGGTRQKIFRTVLATRCPELVRVAIDDLARTITSERVYWRRVTPDTKRVLEIALGHDAVAAAWPAVESYLDGHAPIGDELALRPVGEDCSELSDTGSTALGALCANLLGHPCKAVDTGVRRVMIEALSLDHATAIAVLRDSMGSDDWQTEAALQVIAAAPDGVSLTAPIITDIQGIAVGGDAILRDLARLIAGQHGIKCEDPPSHELPLGYRMALPSGRTEWQYPELDNEGIPFVDTSDPQQVIAPYHRVIRAVAEWLSLDSSAVLHRASQLAQRPHQNRWTDNGVREAADHLKRRGQTHRYRPWAYMVGRRAAGQIMAEIHDAFGADTGPDITVRLDMVAPQLIHIEPAPLNRDDPGPWRPPGTESSSTTSWCDEVEPAATAYKVAIENLTENYVLAERSEWHGLEWATPLEVRQLHTTHGAVSSRLTVLVDRDAWESVGSARRYPRLTYDWIDRQLTVYGREYYTDAPHLEWWALHPAAAGALGWTPTQGALFGWAGPDGALRAKTEFFARGLLSHHAPAAGWAAEVWRVVLTPKGLQEVRVAFPNLRRQLEVTRTLPPRLRDNQRERTGTATVALSEPDCPA